MVVEPQMANIGDRKAREAKTSERQFIRVIKLSCMCLQLEEKQMI